MDGTINLKKHDEEFYSIYKDYENELKKSTFLRFSCIEEKYLNLANNTQSPKYKELNKEFKNCTVRKKKLLSYLQDSILSMNGDKNANDQQKSTSDYFSLCSSYSKNAPDLVYESGNEPFSSEINIDEDIPVSEIEKFRHEKNDEIRLTRSKLQKTKRIKRNIAEHSLLRANEEFVHSKNESVKFGEGSSSFVHNEKSRIQNDEDSLRNSSMNNVIKSKKNKLIVDCNQECSESTKSNLYKIRKDKVKLKNQQDINKSNCLPFRRSSRIQKNFSKTITYIKPSTPDELDEPLLKSDLNVKEKHIKKKKSCKPDLIRNNISSETGQMQSISFMTVKDRDVTLHEKSFKNPNVCEIFGNNMVATSPLTDVRKKRRKSPKRLEKKELKAKDSFCFIKDISKNVKSSKYLVLMKNYDINISNIKRKNSEILCVLPLKSNHISKPEQVNITDKLKEISFTRTSNVDKMDLDVDFSEICSNPSTQSAVIQESQNDQNLSKVTVNAKKENDAVELLLLPPVRSADEQERPLYLQLDFQDVMVPHSFIVKNKTKNRFHISTDGDQVPKFSSHCSMLPSIIEEENESSILLEELSNVNIDPASKSVVIQESLNQMTDNVLMNKSNNLSKPKQVTTLTNTNVSNKYFSPNIKNGDNLECKLDDLIRSQKMSQSPRTPLKKLLSFKETQTSVQNINHISVSHTKVLTDYNTLAKPTSLPLHTNERTASKSKLKILYDENHNKSSNFFNGCQANSDFQKSNSFEPPKKIKKIFKFSKNNTIDINRAWKDASYHSMTNQIFQEEKNKETKQKEKILSATETQTSVQNINRISVSHTKVLTDYNTFAKPTSLPLRKNERTASKSKLKILYDENHNKSSNFFNGCQANSDFQKSNSFEPSKESDVSSILDTSGLNYSLLTKDNSTVSLPSVLDGSFSLFSKSFRHTKENMMKEDRCTHRKTLENELFFPNPNHSYLSLAKNRTLNETLSSIKKKDALSKSSHSKSNSQAAALAPSLWLKSMLSSSKYGS